ncbi:MAG TPA: zinc ribbon domain-containing protein [Bacteroidota bacterium]|nr:zinc ribbon domain-containing protein [Bacteroidota bacterium]
MTCPQCNAESPSGGKFCTVCGSALQSVCSRCGNATLVNDRFCSSCGQALDAAELPVAAPRASLGTRQYTAQEIEELLLLRKAIRREDTASKTLNQDDVDKLFG